MSILNLKPANAPVRAYYATLQKFAKGRFDNEGNIRGAFEDLLKKCARQYDWTLVPEYQVARKGQSPIRIDAALLDAFNLPRGYWEAKDEKDSLLDEMEKKFRAGYPRSNILFQRPTEALLFQDGRIAFHDSIEDPQKLVDVLRLFYEWRQPDHDSWDRAASEFSERIPDIAKGAMALINEERKTNRTFVERFAAFADLCRESINPDLKDEAVEEMLVQHLLTERIFRRIFDNPEFTRRNVIAAEIEKVIDSLTRRQFTYALLHHPEYRTRYSANLKRELPRIPFAPAFTDYARIGADLMKLHLEYESQPEYPIPRTETGKLDWRVEKMALSKDKTQLRYNSFLTLSEIPPEVYEYRLGNRSALEWVIDQYRVNTDKRSGIVNDPNRPDDPEYIVRLIGQVVTVSLETVRLVRELAALPLLPPI